MKHSTSIIATLVALWALAAAGSPTAPVRVVDLPDDTGYHASRFAREVAQVMLRQATRMVASPVINVRMHGFVLMDEGTRELVRASRLLRCHRRGIIDGNCFNDGDRNPVPECR